MNAFHPTSHLCGFQNIHSMQIRLAICPRRHCPWQLILMSETAAHCYSFLNDKSFKSDSFNIWLRKTPAFPRNFPWLLSLPLVSFPLTSKLWHSLQNKAKYTINTSPIIVNGPVWVSLVHLPEGKLLQTWGTLSLYIFSTTANAAVHKNSIAIVDGKFLENKCM